MKGFNFLILALLMASCGIHPHDSISGNGNVINKLVGEDTVRSINISNRLELTWFPSDTFKVELVADENLLDAIHCDLYDGSLRIYTDKHIRMAKSREIRVYGSCIERIEASALAEVGMGDTVDCKSLDIRASSGAEVSVQGNFERLSVHVSSGSSVHLAGRTDYISVDASSAADVFAFDLMAGEGDVNTSSAADARVYITNNAHFNASSASDIKYRGEPRILDSRSSSMGDIRQARF